MTILVTGCAGFIGYHYTNFLLKKKIKVIGVDNLNNYYDTRLKKRRLNNLLKYENFNFYKINIHNKNKISEVFEINKIHIVIHLAAQAGVRFSIKNPSQYFVSNIVGFQNIIDLCKLKKIKHLIFASTSSVYGNNKKIPFKETYDTSNPESFYAATKISNEIIAKSYSSIHKMRITGLRFFTVYGPYGRPDMAIFKFVKNIKNNKFIEVFNNGKLDRDFTYIDDVIKIIYKLSVLNNNYKSLFNIYNVCGSSQKKLMYFIKIIEKKIGKKAKIKFRPMQKGDVFKTYGDNNKLKKIIKVDKFTPLEKGIEKFIKWYEQYY